MRSDKNHESMEDFLRRYLNMLLERGLDDSHLLVKSARSQIHLAKRRTSGALLYLGRPME